MDVLNILLDAKDGDKINAFLKFATEQPLLVYRIYHLWNDMFANADELSKSIKRHKKNVEWQLSRIYKTRNLLMHQGICPPYTRHLLQHLHIYYINIVHNLIHELKRNQSWGICDAFEHQFYLYEHFQSRLKNHKLKPLSKEELMEPILSLSISNGENAWKHKGGG
jgi:hypothetical protein